MKKIALLFALCLGLSVTLTACGGSSYSDTGSVYEMSDSYGGSSYSYGNDYSFNKMETASYYDGFDDDYSYEEPSYNATTDALPASSRKVIRDCHLEIESPESAFDATVEKVTTEVTNAGGYPEELDVDKYYAYLTLRIPTEKVDSFIDALKDEENVFEVTSFNDSRSDVTASYTDTEGRLDAKKKALKRYNELLESAMTVSETLEILNAISDIEGEIEGYTRQLKSYDSLIDYTKVTVRIYEKSAKIEPVKEAFYELGDDLAYNFAHFLEFLAGAIFVVPTALFIIYLAVKVIRLASGKKSSGKGAKKLLGKIKNQKAEDSLNKDGGENA